MTFIVICLTDTNVYNQNEIPMKSPKILVLIYIFTLGTDFAPKIFRLTFYLQKGGNLAPEEAEKLTCYTSKSKSRFEIRQNFHQELRTPLLHVLFHRKQLQWEVWFPPSQ